MTSLFAGKRLSWFRSLALLAACVWQLSGCGGSAERSKNVADSTVASILADLHVESATLQLEIPLDSLVPGTFEPEYTLTSRRDSVLAAYGLSEIEFMQAMEPFINDPSSYVALYDQVLDRLNQKR